MQPEAATAHVPCCRCYAVTLLFGIGVSTLLLALCVLTSLSQRSFLTGEAVSSECHRTAPRLPSPAFSPAAGLSHHASLHVQHAFYDYGCGPVHTRWVPGAAGAKSASCQRSDVYISSAFLDMRPMLLGQAAEVGLHAYATRMPILLLAAFFLVDMCACMHMYSCLACR